MNAEKGNRFVVKPAGMGCWKVIDKKYDFQQFFSTRKKARQDAKALNEIYGWDRDIIPIEEAD
jgi:hypothetical protein